MGVGPKRIGGPGKSRISNLYYVFFRDHTGEQRELAGFENLHQTELAEMVVRLLVLHRATHTPVPRDLVREVERWPKRMRSKLSTLGIIEVGQDVRGNISTDTKGVDDDECGTGDSGLADDGPCA